MTTGTRGASITEDSRIDQITAQHFDATPGDDINPPQPARWVLQVRRVDRVLRDGQVIAKDNHRHVVELHVPDEKGKRVKRDLGDEDPLVQKIAAAIRD